MEDTELEEGEACCYRDDTNIDALSYIDEKLHSVLGHLQKEFEGGFSAENLGAKFGGYGSFLPTYHRSSSIWAQPKTPQRVQNVIAPRSPNVFPMEGAPQNSTAPSDAAQSLRLGTASRSLHSLHAARVPSGEVSSTQDSHLSSAQVIEKASLKCEPTPNKPVNPTDRRTLKVRIKVCSDSIGSKNAAIYSGLGLISPSSSMGNSPQESGGMPSECQGTLDESPNSILQIMTSFSVPGGLLLSPLNESLLCLARKEKLSQNNKPVPAKSGQEHSAVLADDSASSMGCNKVPKEEKTKIVRKGDNLVESKRESGMDFDDNRTTLVKREIAIGMRIIENETLDRKQCLSNEMEVKPLSSSVCNVVDSVEGAFVAPGVPREAERGISVKKREVIKDGMEDRSYTDLVKEESLESISYQEGGKYEKAEASSSSIKKICGSRLRNSRKASTDFREDCQSKGNTASFKADTDVYKCERDSNIGAIDPSKKKVGHKSTYHEQVEIKISHGVGRSSFDGKKKSKRSQSNGKLASEVLGNLMEEVYEVSNEKKKADKMHNSKSQKDIRKVHNNYRHVLPETRVEQIKNQMDSSERPFGGDRTKDSNLDAAEKERCAFFDKSKGISTCKNVDTQLKSGTFMKEAANDVHPSAKGVTSEIEPTSLVPVVIEEDWVCCDRCEKWRLLPYGTKPEQLPEKWLCSMLNWLPKMNRCDISEEATTKALQALYKLPLSESQNNLPNHVDRTASGVSIADVWHFDQNHQHLSSHTMPDPRKKKHGSRETTYPTNGGPIQISGSKKTFQQEGVKRRSINNMEEPILDSNLMSNSNVQHLSKSCNFSMEKITHKQKDKHANSGDAKQKTLKSKREADQHGYRTTKKIKTDVALETGEFWTTEHSGYLDKIGRGSVGGLPTEAAVKSVEKNDEHYYPKDEKLDWKKKVQTSANKQGECASVSLHTASMDIKTYDEREISMKKRKLKDWQESQKSVGTSQNRSHLPESKVFVKEESSDSEFRKAKKYRVSRIEGKDSSTSKGDDRMNRKGKVTRIRLSSSRDNPVIGREKVMRIEKDQQPREHKTKVASNPASDYIDLLKRVGGSEQFSRAAASSSSKISHSCKSRVHFPEVKGSPEESVSSSPLRTSNLEKLSPARRDILERDGARNDDFPVMDSQRKSLDGEGNVESNQFGTGRRGKVSSMMKVGQKFGGKSKSSVEPPELQNSHLVNDVDNLESPCPGDVHASDRCHDEDRMNKNNYHDNASYLHKSGKGSSLQSKDKDRSSDCNFERVKVKVSDPPGNMEVLNPKQSLRWDEVDTGPHHLALLHEESSDVRCTVQSDNKIVGSTGSGKWASESARDNHLKFAEHNGSAVKLGALCRTDGGVTPQQILIRDFEGEVEKRSDPTQVESRGGNSQLFPRHAGKQDPFVHVPQPVPGSVNRSAFDVIPVDSSGNGDLLKVLKQPTNRLGYPMPSQCAFKNAPSPLRRDASSHVASNALKEAEDLKDYADRLKDSGFGFECNEAYLQAALKFFHVASLLETCNVDSSKHGEMSQMQIYSTAAKLSEICAYEHEKRQEMAAAALAYKCMEVAYMKVVYCKNSSMNRDWHDLQASLQMVPQGESPSSSVSDVDNLNNQAMVDKAVLSKGIGAQVGNHVIVARNHPNFVRLLDFTKDVNSAMEASRKSQNAFAAASIILEESQNKEGIISVKRVMDLSFQDVEELIRLVPLAIEAISRQGLSGSKD